MGDDLSFDLGAASWRRDHFDEESFIEGLAQRLERSLPGLARVDREHRLFAKDRPVAGITVELDGQAFVLTRRNGHVETRKSTVVRGVTLSSKPIPMREWLDELSGAITAFAREHEDARTALREFLL